MSIDRLRSHWGLTRTPFSRELAPSMLFSSKTHAEAVARISWLVEERAYPRSSECRDFWSTNVAMTESGDSSEVMRLAGQSGSVKDHGMSA